MTKLDKIIKIAVALILGLGVGLRTVWARGGPDWMYWSGNLMFALFLLVPGLVILLFPQYALVWLRSFGGAARKMRVSEWRKLGPIQKLTLYTLALLDLVIGGVILFVTILQIFSGCSPLGPCPGL